MRPYRLRELFSQYLLEKKKDLDNALSQFKEVNRREIAMAGDFLITLTSDESYIALLCDNLATLATVWAEVRRDFFSSMSLFPTNKSERFRLDLRLSVLRTNLTEDCR